MSVIVISAKLASKDEINVKCNIKGIDGKYDILVHEMAAILITIDDKVPGLIEDALDLLIEIERHKP